MPDLFVNWAEEFGRIEASWDADCVPLPATRLAHLHAAYVALHQAANEPRQGMWMYRLLDDAIRELSAAGEAELVEIATEARDFKCAMVPAIDELLARVGKMMEAKGE